MNTRAMRQAAGVAVLLAAAGAIAILSVPYWQNRAYGEELSMLVVKRAREGWDAERWRLEAMQLAARRGLPVEAADVQVEGQGTGTRVEVRYQKNVDLFFYSVRLHMRAKSGS